MKLTGVITNITAFGAFVDIGVHQDGLVHLSEMADRFVKTPADVVKVNQKVEVTVLAVDADRKRISLSLKKQPAGKPAKEKIDRDTVAEPAKRIIAPGKSPQHDAKKQGKQKPQPFNNPFADALRRR